MDLGDAVDDSHSTPGEESPGHLGSSFTNLHAADNLPRYNNKVERSVAAFEQLGSGFHNEVGRSNIAPQQSEGCNKVVERSDGASGLLGRGQQKEVRRRIVASEQSGMVCHKEVGRSNIATEQSDKGCNKAVKRSDVDSRQECDKAVERSDTTSRFLGRGQQTK